MIFKSFGYLLLLPAAIRTVCAQNSTSSSSTACNNSPSLCNRAYDQVTYLGAHDSPFLRDESTYFSTSGNQFYSTTVQLSAGVRLLTAQVQLNDNNQLHVCHTSCDLLDAGTLSSWLGEVRSWMNSNPNEVVTIIIVNGAQASAADLAAQYENAGITTSLAYTPSGSTAETQNWPTLSSLINSGTRLLNFVDSLSDNSATPYLMHQYDYMFENNYNVTSLGGFSCEGKSSSAEQALSGGMMALMNHFMYSNAGLGIQIPAIDNITTTNSPGAGVGMLGQSARECTQYYNGRAPSYILVDFFNVGPAIKTVDRLNGVSNPVGRRRVSTAILQSGAGVILPNGWALWVASLTASFAFALL